MSLHPSLKIDTAGAQQRTVLTRIERMKDLMKKGLWQDNQRVTGLPKTKILKVKARKKVKEEAVAEAGAATGAATTVAQPEAKPKEEKKEKKGPAKG